MKNISAYYNANPPRISAVARLGSYVVFARRSIFFFTFEDLSAHRVEDVSLVVEATDLTEQPLHLRLRAPDAHHQHGSARDYLSAELLPWWTRPGATRGEQRESVSREHEARVIIPRHGPYGGSKTVVSITEVLLRAGLPVPVRDTPISGFFLKQKKTACCTTMLLMTGVSKKPRRLFGVSWQSMTVQGTPAGTSHA